MVFLGFLVSTKTMIISIPVDKIRNVVQEAKRLLEKNAVSVRDLVRFVGKTMHDLKMSNSGAPFLSSTPAGTGKQHHFTPDYGGNLQGRQSGNNGIIRR